MSNSLVSSGGWGERATVDLSSLLVELGRAIKGLGFYELGHPARRDLLDRAYLAWRIELERAGPLDVTIEVDCFRAAGIREELPHGRLAELATALLERGVERFSFTPDVTQESFYSFADMLSLEPRSLALSGGFAEVFFARSPRGILIGDVKPEDLEELDRSAAAAALVAATATASVDSSQPQTESTPAPLVPSRPQTMPLPGASLGSLLLSAGPSIVIDEPVAPIAMSDDVEDASPPSEATDPPATYPADEEPTTDRSEELWHLLSELDRCTDDERYSEITRQLVGWIEVHSDHGIGEEAYRLALVLADHAVGEGGRSGVQASTAQRALRDLARKDLLRLLIDLASAPEPSRSVRAAQVLLVIGESAATAVLDRLEEDSDPSQVTDLAGVLLALGENAIDPLLRAIEDGPRRRSRIALRVAGELGSPRVVPLLVSVLTGADTHLAQEAAQSLARIGGPRAMAALLKALDSQSDELAEAAAAALGARGEQRALDPLLEQLELATQSGRVGLAKQIIGALGMLGSDRAVPRLVTILERKNWLRRWGARELKVASAAALERLPGREALLALERAARSSDTRVSACARRALERRPQDSWTLS